MKRRRGLELVVLRREKRGREGLEEERREERDSINKG
jgi:hypothetical protein